MMIFDAIGLGLVIMVCLFLILEDYRLIMRLPSDDISCCPSQLASKIIV